MGEQAILTKRWLTPDAVDQEAMARLQQETQHRLPPLVCRLLVQRGITGVDDARDFLAPKLEHLHDPATMKGVPEAVGRLMAARAAGRRVAVLGDYDVDGLSSAALLTQVLERLGFDVTVFVPHRMVDGYGVSLRALDRFKEEGVELVLTCDTGISAMDEIRYAVEDLGLEVVVTDHHTAPEELPPAHVIVNPRQAGCPYPFKDLCGAGVAFKLLQALVRAMGLDEEEVLWPYLDLVALGTVCDVVPLRGENRILAKWGIRVARQTNNLGLRTLCDVLALPLGQLDESSFGWIIGPRLNAAGRIDDAALALDLLLSRDPAEAERLARRVDALNTDRRAQTQQILDSANRLVLDGPDLEGVYGISLFGDENADCAWHHGVLGIVASKLVENYGRPAFLFAYDQASGKWKGSGRAPADVGTVNLYDALAACSSHLYKFGGHAAAAGATLRATDRQGLDAFAQAFDEAVRAQMRPEDRVPTLRADLDVRIGDLSPELWAMLRRFAPFGHGNEPVSMIVRGADVASARVIGKENNHLKLHLRHGSTGLDALGWGFVDRYPQAAALGQGARVDVFFRLDENVFRGQIRLQMLMDDLRVVDAGKPAGGPAPGPATTCGSAGAAGKPHPRGLFA